MIWWILTITSYLLLYILTVGLSFAYFQRHWPDLAEKDWREDFGSACFMALFAPISCPLLFLLTGFAKHGLLWWPEHKTTKRGKYV